jgi:hypothetical protein
MTSAPSRQICKLTLEIILGRRTHQSGIAERKAITDRIDQLPLTKQAKLLRIFPSSDYYSPMPLSAIDQQVVVRIYRRHLEFPFACACMLRGLLLQEA